MSWRLLPPISRTPPRRLSPDSRGASDADTDDDERASDPQTPGGPSKGDTADLSASTPGSMRNQKPRRNMLSKDERRKKRLLYELNTEYKRALKIAVKAEEHEDESERADTIVVAGGTIRNASAAEAATSANVTTPKSITRNTRKTPSSKGRKGKQKGLRQSTLRINPCVKTSSSALGLESSSSLSPLSEVERKLGMHGSAGGAIGSPLARRDIGERTDGIGQRETDNDDVGQKDVVMDESGALSSACPDAAQPIENSKTDVLATRSSVPEVPTAPNDSVKGRSADTSPVIEIPKPLEPVTSAKDDDHASWNSGTPSPFPVAAESSRVYQWTGSPQKATDDNEKATTVPGNSNASASIGEPAKQTPPKSASEKSPVVAGHSSVADLKIRLSTLPLQKSLWLVSSEFCDPQTGRLSLSRLKALIKERMGLNVSTTRLLLNWRFPIKRQKDLDNCVKGLWKFGRKAHEIVIYDAMWGRRFPNGIREVCSQLEASNPESWKGMQDGESNQPMAAPDDGNRPEGSPSVGTPTPRLAKSPDTAKAADSPASTPTMNPDSGRRRRARTDSSATTASLLSAAEAAQPSPSPPTNDSDEPPAKRRAVEQPGSGPSSACSSARPPQDSISVQVPAAGWSNAESRWLAGSTDEGNSDALPSVDSNVVASAPLPREPAEPGTPMSNQVPSVDVRPSDTPVESSASAVAGPQPMELVEDVEPPIPAKESGKDDSVPAKAALINASQIEEQTIQAESIEDTAVFLPRGQSSEDKMGSTYSQPVEQGGRGVLETKEMAPTPKDAVNPPSLPASDLKGDSRPKGRPRKVPSPLDYDLDLPPTGVGSFQASPQPPSPTFATDPVPSIGSLQNAFRVTPHSATIRAEQKAALNNQWRAVRTESRSGSSTPVQPVSPFTAVNSFQQAVAFQSLRVITPIRFPQPVQRTSPVQPTQSTHRASSERGTSWKDNFRMVSTIKSSAERTPEVPDALGDKVGASESLTETVPYVMGFNELGKMEEQHQSHGANGGAGKRICINDQLLPFVSERNSSEIKTNSDKSVAAPAALTPTVVENTLVARTSSGRFSNLNNVAYEQHDTDDAGSEMSSDVDMRSIYEEADLLLLAFSGRSPEHFIAQETSVWDQNPPSNSGYSSNTTSPIEETAGRPASSRKKQTSSRKSIHGVKAVIGGQNPRAKDKFRKSLTVVLKISPKKLREITTPGQSVTQQQTLMSIESTRGFTAVNASSVARIPSSAGIPSVSVGSPANGPSPVTHPAPAPARTATAIPFDIPRPPPFRKPLDASKKLSGTPCMSNAMVKPAAASAPIPVLSPPPPTSSVDALANARKKTEGRKSEAIERLDSLGKTSIQRPGVPRSSNKDGGDTGTDEKGVLRRSAPQAASARPPPPNTFIFKAAPQRPLTQNQSSQCIIPNLMKPAPAMSKVPVPADKIPRPPAYSSQTKPSNGPKLAFSGPSVDPVLGSHGYLPPIIPLERVYGTDPNTPIPEMPSLVEKGNLMYFEPGRVRESWPLPTLNPSRSSTGPLILPFICRRPSDMQFTIYRFDNPAIKVCLYGSDFASPTQPERLDWEKMSELIGEHLRFDDFREALVVDYRDIVEDQETLDCARFGTRNEVIVVGLDRNGRPIEKEIVERMKRERRRRRESAEVLGG